MSNMNTSRRDVLKAGTVAGIAAGLGAWPTLASANTLSANEELRIAVIGVRGRGNEHINGFQGAKGAKLVAFCDADTAVLNSTTEKYEKKFNATYDKYEDYRKLLDNKDIDAITIATPNHWHALMTIDAVKAGKHVYVEKPVCHNVWEGRQMVEIVKQSDRIVGAGFQNRSDKGLIAAYDYIQQGNIGKTLMGRGLCYRKRASIGKQDKPLTPPKSVNYDMWLGPADDEPMFRPQFHYDWHWVWNTGNGDMGNQGPHEMDVLRWFLGEPMVHPSKVMSFGGRFGWDDAGNTPNMQIASIDYGNGVPVYFEVRDLSKTPDGKDGVNFKGQSVDIILTCEGGEFRGGRGGGAIYDADGKKVKEFKGDSGGTHMQNFVDCVLSNDGSKLRSPLESAFLSSSLSHLSNISTRCGRDATMQEILSAVGHDANLTEAASRFADHLKAWSVDYEKTPWSLGPTLTFDPAAEKFTAGENLELANKMLKREGRAGYVIPTAVKG
jgi:predicted dehydrogenase